MFKNICYKKHENKGFKGVLPIDLLDIKSVSFLSDM